MNSGSEQDVWYRIFGLAETAPDLAAMLQQLHAAGFPVVAHFRGDDLGWTGGELTVGDQSVMVERYLAKEDDLRDELNTWAAWLETRSDQPRHGELMQHVIGTKQLVTLRPGDSALNPLCDVVCQWLAGMTEGVYQVDARGFIAADGKLLLSES